MASASTDRTICVWDPSWNCIKGERSRRQHHQFRNFPKWELLVSGSEDILSVFMSK
jgi:hypothetical protein